MKLQLQNILKVESADIELGGLTVITGENDSGKSSIGKVLFSLLKATNNVKQVDKFKTLQFVNSHLLSVKRLFSHYNNVQILQDIQSTSIDLVEKNLTVEVLAETIKKEAIKCGFTNRQAAILNDKFTQIQQNLSELENPVLAVKREFDIISRSEFMEPLSSYGTPHSSIYFHDDTTDADGSDINLTFENGKISDIKLWGDSSIEDITYVESPVYLHILDTLRMSSSVPTKSFRGISNSLQKGNIPYHLGDMAEKILNTAEDLLGLFHSNNYQPQLDEIRQLIGGNFTVDEKTKQLYFLRNGISIPAVSVASGIKSFGVLLRLLQTDSISTSKMLVLDEPEIHLHPEWQISFCQFIVELVTKGIPIVVSSHSPYFIQGLRYFAAARGIEKDVVYYMAEQSSDTGLSKFKDVTNDLNQVFTLLAAPLREIMNVDAVRNSLK